MTVQPQSEDQSADNRIEPPVAGDEKAVKRFGQADGVPRRTNRVPAREGPPVAQHGFLTAYRSVSGRPC